MDIAVIMGEIAFISRYRIINGIVDAAKKDGVNIILFTCEGFIFHDLKDYSLGEYRIFQLPAMEKYDGIIVDIDSIQNEKTQEELFENIKNSNIPCVSFNREMDVANEIYFDNRKGFEELLEHLIVDHKLEDIHYLSGPNGNRDAQERLNVYKNTMAAHGLSVKPENIYEGDFNFGSGKRAAVKYLSSGKKLPQAIVAANDLMAVGLMEELKANGVRIPEDMVITGYDNRELAFYTEPRLTTVDRGEYEAGILAYKKLLSNINETEERGYHEVSGKLIIGGSCGCKSHKTISRGVAQSVVELKMHLDESLDIIKEFSIRLSSIDKNFDFQHSMEQYVEEMGMEYFYFCQCGSRESYYEELEILASGKKVKRNMTVYQDMVWCPVAYEKGEWNYYPSYSRRNLFPPNSLRGKTGNFYIVMPVHQGNICIGYSIIGNFSNTMSGRVLQHLVIGIEQMLGNQRQNDIMTTMLAQINRKWKYDELTGLLNRSGLIQNAENLIENAVIEKMGITVIFFDLDGLKAVNDADGHEAGDQYIKLMADILQRNAGKDDIVCRYGGDEYIVIAKQRTREDGIQKLKTLQAAITEPLSASSGCAFEHISGMNELNTLIEKADKRMYDDKKRKKCVRV